MIIYFNAAHKETHLDFNYIYSKYKNLVWYYIERSGITGECLKEEIMQDIFVKLYNTLCKLQSEQAIKRWLTVVAKSTIIDAERKSLTYKKYISITLDDEDMFEGCMNMFENTPLDNLVKNEMAKALMDKLRKLKPIHYEVIIMYYYMEFSVKEIAKRLKLPQNTVYSRLNRARNILYETIDDSIKEYFFGGGVLDE